MQKELQKLSEELADILTRLTGLNALLCCLSSASNDKQTWAYFPDAIYIITDSLQQVEDSIDEAQAKISQLSINGT